LNFFLTLIVPLVMTLYSFQNIFTFGTIIVMIFLLLWKTNLFYANPVLSLFGYNVYEFNFKENATYENRLCIGLIYGSLDDKQMIEYQILSNNANNVFYLRGVENANKP